MTQPTTARRMHLSYRLSELLVTWFLASCSNMQDDPHSAPPRHQTLSKLVQLNFGQQAEFDLCAEPNCPTVTRKTIAAAPNRQPAPGDIAPTQIATVNQPIQSARPTAPRVRPVVVHFRLGDASLSESDKAILDSVIASEVGVQRIAISGRTDGTGSVGLNDNLATARAQSVEDYIRSKYPTLAQVLTRSAQGTCCYVATNGTTDGRRLNRRAEVLITSDASKQP